MKDIKSHSPLSNESILLLFSVVVEGYDSSVDIYLFVFKFKALKSVVGIGKPGHFSSTWLLLSVFESGIGVKICYAYYIILEDKLIVIAWTSSIKWSIYRYI